MNKKILLITTFSLILCTCLFQTVSICKKVFLSKIHLSQNFNEKRLLHKADILILKNKHKDAVRILDKVISRNPQNQFAYHQRGFAKFVLNDWNGVIEDFNTVEKLGKPLYEGMYFYRGYAYVRTGEYKKGILDYDRYLDYELNQLVYYERAIAKCYLKEWKNAIDDFNSYIKYIESDPNAYFYRAQCYFKLNNNNNAIVNLFKAIALYSELNEDKNSDIILTIITKISEKSKNCTDKEINELFPEINRNFNFLTVTPRNKYIFYIDPQKWSFLKYEDKIALLQKAIFFSMYKDILEKCFPKYNLSKKSVEIHSSLNGEKLTFSKAEKDIKKDTFNDITLQKLAENHHISKSFKKTKTTIQNEILSDYTNLIQSVYDEHMFQYSDNDNIYMQNFQITIDRNGYIQNISSIDIPENKKLYNSALIFIKQIQPLPQIPPEYSGKNIKITIKIKVDADY